MAPETTSKDFSKVTGVCQGTKSPISQPTLVTNTSATLSLRSDSASVTPTSVSRLSTATLPVMTAGTSRRTLRLTPSVPLQDIIPVDSSLPSKDGALRAQLSQMLRSWSMVSHARYFHLLWRKSSVLQALQVQTP